MSSTSVSVIVPVYNVEPFVSQCLESLVRQSLGNLEIIVVDDGSTDATPDIIRSFARQHKSISVITQENSGLSAARNAGMAVAQGEFIGFVDGDDWVDESMFEALFSMAISCQADIIIGNGQLVDHETGVIKPIQDDHVWATLKARYDTLILSPRKEPDLFMLDTSVCKRLFRREFLESLKFRFPDGMIFEDIPTHFHLLLNTGSVVLIDRKFYFYRTNRPERITARTVRSLLQVFEVMQKVTDDLYRHEADLAIWVNFVWFQAWVLKWLRNQVTRQYLDEFIEKSAILARNFKDGSVSGYLDKFKRDRQANIFVMEQVRQARFWKKSLESGQVSDQLENSRITSQRLHRQLDAVYESKSWRITAPLRWLLKSLKSEKPPNPGKGDRNN